MPRLYKSAQANGDHEKAMLIGIGQLVDQFQVGGTLI